MLSVVPVKDLSLKDIAFLRTISEFSISEIRVASENQGSIRDFHIFGPDWQDEREELARLVTHFAATPSPSFHFIELEDDETSGHLTLEMLRNLLDQWRGIELDEQRHQDLETGEITDDADFVAHDDDWRPIWDELIG